MEKDTYNFTTEHKMRPWESLKLITERKGKKKYIKKNHKSQRENVGYKGTKTLSFKYTYFFLILLAYTAP